MRLPNPKENRRKNEVSKEVLRGNTLHSYLWMFALTCIYCQNAWRIFHKRSTSVFKLALHIWIPPWKCAFFSPQTAGLMERIKAVNEMYNGINKHLINLLKKTTGHSLFYTHLRLKNNFNKAVIRSAHSRQWLVWSSSLIVVSHRCSSRLADWVCPVSS